MEALERVIDRLCRLERLRALELCILAPAMEPGRQKAFFICAGGLCAVRSLRPGARREIEAALARCSAARERAQAPLTPEQAEDLLLVDGFIRRTPAELTVLPLDPDRIEACSSEA